MKPSSHRDRDGSQKTSSKIPTLEWVVSGLGLLIVAGAVGVLLYEGIAGDQSPPEIALSVQSIDRQQNGFLVKIRAENIGGEPAGRVDILAELTEGAKVVETSGTQFEHLPPRSKRDAGVFFQRDPRLAEIRLQTKGYEAP